MSREKRELLGVLIGLVLAITITSVAAYYLDDGFRSSVIWICGSLVGLVLPWLCGLGASAVLGAIAGVLRWLELL